MLGARAGDRAGERAEEAVRRRERREAESTAGCLGPRTHLIRVRARVRVWARVRVMVRVRVRVRGRARDGGKGRVSAAGVAFLACRCSGLRGSGGSGRGLKTPREEKEEKRGAVNSTPSSRGPAAQGKVRT